jgi:hypothetical protein
MTLTNHLLSGAVLGKFLPLPVAIPLAFASHFVLDALPHFGFKSLEEYRQRTRILRIVMIVDLLFALFVSWRLITSGHATWFLVGVVAFSPDLIWLRWLLETAWNSKSGKNRDWSASNWFTRFHEKIQRYERSWGIVVELLTGTIFLILLHR